MTHFSTIDEACPLTAPGRGGLSSARLEEHLRATVKFLEKIGIRSGMSIASALPKGPDAATAALAAKMAHIDLLPLPARASCERYQSLLLGFDVQLLLLHSGSHPAREAAEALGIPVANVLRHFEAGIFTLEIQIGHRFTPPPPQWKNRASGVPVMLVAPGAGQRSLAKHLDVIGIDPPLLDDLRPPYTIEHIAAECIRNLRPACPSGPIAIAGWRTGALIALEMARLFEEGGERVRFVALLDAAALLSDRGMLWSLHKKLSAPHDLMAEAICHYRPRPWFGRILNIRRRCRSERTSWRRIAPQGVLSYEAPSDLLGEPNVEVLAKILAAELRDMQKSPCDPFHP